MSFKEQRARALQEYPQAIEVLRAKWPKAFPVKFHEVRPLIVNITPILIEEFGWDKVYAHSIIGKWKRKSVYCKAILLYKYRITLDGSQSQQEVDDEARELAAQKLKTMENYRKSVKAPVAPSVAAVPAKSKPVPIIAEPVQEAPPIAIEPKRTAPSPVAQPSKRGKLLLAGSTAMRGALERRIASGFPVVEVVNTLPVPKNKRAR